MAIANFSIRRPITIIMAFLGIILFGLISWSKLPQELYPPIIYPQLSVVTFYKDAAPEEMEILVTKPIEETVGTVSGVRRISSTSKEETSLVIAEFNWGTNMDFAALGVREKIDLIKESLPRASEDPIVIKYNPFELPLAVLNITADKTPAGELQDIVKKIIKNEVEKTEGVAACNIIGGLVPEVLVEINQDKLVSKGVALNEVVEALSKANLNYPAGTIEESFYEYLIRTMGEFKLVKEMDEVVVSVDDRTEKSQYPEFGPEEIRHNEERAITNKRLVLLKDIATVKETFKEKTSVSRYNGKENISVSIQKQADANTLNVANSVRTVISRLKKMVPGDVHIDMVYDQSAFIKSAISGVTNAALQGGFLAFLVLLFFLRNFRSAAIVTCNIPISIMAVFALMYFSGLTLNIISLGGLALGVGMLVDNGIVVIENIFRYREEERKSVKEASALGANEVGGAIAGSTLTTIAVFLPMVFVIGVAGQLFKELAFTVTFSLLTSLAVAMTLVPILSSTEHRIPGFFSKETGIIGRILTFVYSVNEKILIFFLNHKAMSLLIIFGIFISAITLIPALDTEFLPRIDQGQFIIKLSLPPGTRLQVTDSVAKVIESHLAKMNEVESTTVNIGSTKEKKGAALLETIGPHEAQIIVNLKPLVRWYRQGPQYRTISTSNFLQRLKNVLRHENISNAKLEYILQESMFKTAFQTGAPVIIEIKGQDMGRLRKIAIEVEGILRKVPGIYSIRNSIMDPAPEVKINVFKEKATTYNLSVSEIALTAQIAVKGYIATKFKREGEEIDIRVRLRRQDRDNLSKVTRLNIHSPLGIDIPLAETAYFSIGKGPIEIKRQGQERVVVVTANIFERSFREVSDIISGMLKRLKLSSGYSAELTGEREQIQESFNSLRLALILSVVLVFMIMASEFESLWQPFVIMFTIPLSVIGVILILFLTHTPLSVMVILGVIILGGIVVNNGIVLVDYTNILRRQGMSAYDALIIASRRRLRPILMTALTTILGLVPLALALTEGSELQQPMAITVIGGLTVSTFLSLVVIPTIYLGWEGIILFIKKNIFGINIEKKTSTPPPPEEGPSLPEEGPPPEGSQPPTPPKEGPSTPEGGLSLLPPEKGLSAIEESPPKIHSAHEEPLLLEEKELKKENSPAPEAYTQEKLTGERQEEKSAIPLPPPEEEKPPGPPVQKPNQERLADNADNMVANESIPLKIWDSLGSRQKWLIRYIRQNRKITRKEYADKFNLSLPTAARDLKFLSDKEVLIAKGPAARGRYYILNHE